MLFEARRGILKRSLVLMGEGREIVTFEGEEDCPARPEEERADLEERLKAERERLEERLRGKVEELAERVLAEVRGELGRLRGEFERVLAELAGELVELAIRAAERALLVSLPEVGREAARRVIEEGLKKLRAKGEAIVRVSEGLVEFVREAFSGVRVVVDEDLGDFDVVIEAESGVVDGRIRTRLAEVGRAVRGALGDEGAEGGFEESKVGIGRG